MRTRTLAIAAAIALALLSATAHAEDDATSLSYISYLERYATVRPADGSATLDAVINMPVLAGDRMETARGARVEVQLADGTTLWLDEFSTLDFDAVAFSRDAQASHTSLYLVEGAATVEIPEVALGDGTMRFDSPGGTVYLHRPGLYRVDVRGGPVRVEALSGLVELPSGVGSALLRTGQQAWLGTDGAVETAAVNTGEDDFTRWVGERRHPRTDGPTAQYVDARDAQRAGILDSYGEWVYVDAFSSRMWRPRVGAGWAPYSNGRWYWTPVGWNWISYEPWGWYPFHYGSWYLDAQLGWLWCWDWVWGPAWVDWLYTPGYVGWCPRGYYDFWYYNQFGYGHRGGGGGPVGPGHVRPPRRWARHSLDFSGRVRLRDVDPLPWTIVPSGQFTNTNLSRVRLAPGRFEKELAPDREAFVRSGPLFTRTPARTAPEEAFDRGFRAENRPVPGLSSLLRRQAGTATSDVRALMLRTSTTDDIVRQSRRSPESAVAPRGGAGGGAGAAPSPGRSGERATPSRPGASPGTRAVPRSSEVVRGSQQPATPRSSNREVAPRTVQRQPAPSRPSSPPPSRNVTPPPPVQRVPDRPPSRWSSQSEVRRELSTMVPRQVEPRSRTEVRRWETTTSTGPTLLEPRGRVLTPRPGNIAPGGRSLTGSAPSRRAAPPRAVGSPSGRSVTTRTLPAPSRPAAGRSAAPSRPATRPGGGSHAAPAQRSTSGSKGKHRG